MCMVGTFSYFVIVLIYNLNYIFIIFPSIILNNIVKKYIFKYFSLYFKIIYWSFYIGTYRTYIYKILNDN